MIIYFKERVLRQNQINLEKLNALCTAAFGAFGASPN